MIGHPCHRNGLAVMFSPRRQCDVEDAGCLYGIFEEELVEIAHAEEQERIGMLCLDRQILRHERRRLCGGGGSGGIWHGAAR